MRIVIPTTPADQDAISVATALKLSGHDATLWQTSDYPGIQFHTASFGHGTRFHIRDSLGNDEDWHFDVCWLRDLGYNPEPPEGLHPDDRAFVAKIGQRYNRQSWGLLASSLLPDSPAFWINSLEAARRAESKLLQLHLAELCGFDVPETIVSNDPVAIRAFIARLEPAVVRKSLAPHFWRENDDSCTNGTSRVSSAELPSDRILSVHAEIYQRAIEKSAEVRVVFFGGTCFALKIEPGAKAGRFVDWRIYHFPGLTRVTQFELPEHIYTCCRLLMRKLGVVSASFDLLLDQCGNYHFAELNQGGLFLWMEAHGVPVLQAFCDFIVSGDEDFRWSPRGRGRGCGSLVDVHETALFKDLLNSAESHLSPPQQMLTKSSGN